MANTEQTTPQAKGTKDFAFSVVLLSVTLSVLLLFFAAQRSEGQVQDHAAPPDLRTAAQMARVAAPEKARLLRELGQAMVSTNAETGALASLSAPEGGAIGRPSGMAANAPAETAARGYMAKYGKLFGIEDQKSDLRTEETKRAYEGKGRSVVSFRQVYKGVPVIAGELNVEVDGDNDLLIANGEALPEISLDTEPSVRAEEAQQTALQKVAGGKDLAKGDLKTTRPELWVHDPRLMGGPGAEEPRLVWRMDVQDAGGLDELVLVDAHSGNVALHIDQTESALNRKTFTTFDQLKWPLPGVLLCGESDPVCVNGDTDAKKAHFFAKDTYDFYLSHHKRDGIDGAGTPITSTVHACSKDEPSCPMENAFWDPDSKQMVYGKGFIADDVAAHEMTHGVTRSESDLFSYYQSGAINESLSDTWGEWVDQTNGKGTDDASVRWELGEDLPGGALRDMSDPTLFGDPDRMTSSLYSGSSSDRGGIHTNNGVGNKAASLITDGGYFNGHLVIGLGLNKASQVYYKVQTDLLRSGSDYTDLGSDLNLACNALVGKDLIGTTAKITPNDCLQVSEAVAATEMMKQPPVAKAPEAPVCDAGTTRNDVLFWDDMENTSSGFWKTSSGTWFYDTEYATNGIRALHAEDPATKADFFLEKELPVKVPAGTKTFLRFDHAYQFDSSGGYADGGLLEFRLPFGSWQDAGPMFTSGSGYDGTLASNVGNPLGGHKAFVGSSHGYRSSRVNLSSLGGNQVSFRFRTVTNSVNGNKYGWYLDNLRVYTCK